MANEVRFDHEPFEAAAKKIVALLQDSKLIGDTPPGDGVDATLVEAGEKNEAEHADNADEGADNTDEADKASQETSEEGERSANGFDQLAQGILDAFTHGSGGGGEAPVTTTSAGDTPLSGMADKASNLFGGGTPGGGMGAAGNPSAAGATGGSQSGLGGLLSNLTGGSTPGNTGTSPQASGTNSGSNPVSNALRTLTGAGADPTNPTGQGGATTPGGNNLAQHAAHALGLNPDTDTSTPEPGDRPPADVPVQPQITSGPTQQYEWYEPTPATATQYDVTHAPNRQQLADDIYNALNDSEANGGNSEAVGTGQPGDDRPRPSGADRGSINQYSDDERDRKAQEIQEHWVSQGVPYAWGGGHGSEPGPTQGISDGGGQADRMGDYNKIGLDCSGYGRQVIYELTGQDLAFGSAADQYNTGTPVSPDEARPGDLVFPESAGRPPQHIQVYAGGNQVSEAQQSGTDLMFSELTPSEFRRFG